MRLYDPLAGEKLLTSGCAYQVAESYGEQTDFANQKVLFPLSTPGECWSIGISVNWYIGTLVHWYIGKLVHWSHIPPIYQSTSLPIYQSTSLPIYRFPNLPVYHPSTLNLDRCSVV
ncbi:MAG: hypothetical protein H8E47_02045 [Anaerolineales bacterium]|nr:hypothetical protein [Anaerolineales bacterium]